MPRKLARFKAHNPRIFSQQTTNNRSAIALAAIIVVALALGGGGVRYGIFNLAVQCAALAVLAFHYDAFVQFWRQAPRTLKLLVGASILLPLLHAVPLPANAWTSLPGRDPVIESFALIGADQHWASLSVDPARTWVALSGLIVPVIVVMVAWPLMRQRLEMLGWLIAVLGLLNVLIGIPQVLSNGTSGLFYPENPMPGVLFGTFANRNSTGIFLVSALALACLLPPPIRHPGALPARLAVCLLLLVGILLTRSRTALVLASIPVALGFVKTFIEVSKARQTTAQKRGMSLAVLGLGGAALVFVTLATITAVSPGRIGDTLARFEATSDARTFIWEDAAFSVSRYWPVGSGMGTFDEVFQLDESLENMTLRRAGRAHNDYIEVAIEAGAPGLAIILGWLCLCLWYAIRASRTHTPWSAWAGGTILLVVALQSITDYPLRNQAMLAVASFGLVLLARLSEPGGRQAA